MQATTSAQRARRAKQEAERLFWSLRRVDAGDAIRVIYPRCFPRGECFIAALVPIDCETVRKVNDVSLVHMKYRYQPRITNGAHGRRLRLMWRFKEILPDTVPKGDEITPLQAANEIARWIEEVFDRRAIVCSVKGLFASSRLQLRAS